MNTSGSQDTILQNSSSPSSIRTLSTEEEAHIFERLSALLPASIDAKYANGDRTITQAKVARTARSRRRRRYMVGSISTLIASIAAGTGAVQVAQRNREKTARVLTDQQASVGYWVVSDLPDDFVLNDVSDPSFVGQRNDYRTFGALFSDGKTSFTVTVVPKGQDISLPGYDPLQPASLVIWNINDFKALFPLPGDDPAANDSSGNRFPADQRFCIRSFPSSSNGNTCVFSFENATVAISGSVNPTDSQEGIAFDERSRTVSLAHLPSGFSYVGPYNVSDAFAVDYLNTAHDDEEIELQVGRLGAAERSVLSKSPTGEGTHTVQRVGRTYRITEVSHRNARSLDLVKLTGTDQVGMAPVVDPADGFDRTVVSWTDDTGLWFSLAGTRSEDEMIRLAESVTKATPEQQAELFRHRQPSSPTSNTPLAQQPVG